MSMLKPLNFPRFISHTAQYYTRMGRYSPESVLASTMVVAHESTGGTHWVQKNGPALGIIQMEPDTHESTWKWCDNIQLLADKMGITKNVNQLVSSLDYNLFMMRCRFLMDTNPFPKDIRSMAEYLKDYWNSAEGKASANKYLTDYQWWSNAKNTQCFDEVSNY